jgi:hypothetical protein
MLALAISLIAFNQAGNHRGLKVEIENLQEKMAEVKEETADRLERIRQETGQAFGKIGEAIKIEDSE